MTLLSDNLQSFGAGYRVASTLQFFIWAVSLISIAGCRTSGLLYPTPLSTQQSSSSEQACLSRRSQPSCFYKRDATGKQSKLIVFVHGIFGSGVSTWGDPQSESFWPAMVAADGRFANYDIYLVNYPTPFLDFAPSIYETALSELNHLKDYGIFKQYKDIHIIGYSMGGLVTKSLLITLANSRDAELAGKIKTVLFLATPAQGASVATLGSWFSANPQLKEMARAHLNAFIQKLEDEWVEFMLVRDKARARFPRVYCAYETLPTNGVFVVPREMANTRCDSPLHPMPFNHLNVAVPTLKNADPYFWVMSRIMEANEVAEQRMKADDTLARAEHLRLSGNPLEARQSYTSARRLYQLLGDQLGEANTLRALGDIERVLGRNDEARANYTEARSLYKKVEDRRGEGNVLRGIGDLERALGRNEQARGAYTEALKLFKEVPDQRGEANVFWGLGYLETTLSHVEPAREAFVKALKLYRTINNKLGEANVLLGVAELELTLKRIDQARTAYMEARTMYKSVNDRQGEANVLRGVGELERLVGRFEQARENYADALKLYRTLHDSMGEANIFLAVAELESAIGRADYARIAYSEAQRLYREAENRLGEANALKGRGYLEANRNPELARQYFYQAAGLYDAIQLNYWKEVALKEAQNLAR